MPGGPRTAQRASPTARRGWATSLCAALLAVLACDPQGGGVAETWRAELSPGPDGVTEELLLPVPPSSAAALHLWVEAPAQRCLQIESLRGDGRELVSPPVGRADFGTVCARCSEHVSVLRGQGRYTLPAGAGPLSLRLGARDCTTLLPTEAPGERWHLDVRFSLPPPTDARVTLALRVYLGPGAWLRGVAAPEAVLGEVLREAEAQLGPGLSLRLAGVRALGAPDPLTLERDDLAAAAALTGEPEGDALPVLLLGCLLLDEPLTGRRVQPDGLVPRVPGGPVLLRGRACTEGAAPFVWPAAALGKILAHELGHALGLYHSVEEDGSEDALPDTGAENLMNFQPLMVGARGLSPLQRQVLRLDPRLR